MMKVRTNRLIRGAIAKVSLPDTETMERHIETISNLGMDEIDELMTTDDGMRQLAGPLYDLQVPQIRSPKFSELVAAVPGRMTDEEYAKVLSGGTPQQWGPWPALAKRLKARRLRK
jgi:hypothetical protein